MNRPVRRILLLNPPDPVLLGSGSHYSYFEPPLGILYVYAYLKNRPDLEVKFVDLNIEMKFISGGTLSDTICRILGDFRPDLVGISALYYAHIHVVHTMTRLVKAFDSGIYTVLGGIYPTHLTKECMADDNVDFAILSEGELGMSELIDSLHEGKDLAGVEGLARRENGELRIRSRNRFWEGYEESGRLPWEDIPFHHYFQEGRNVLHRLRARESMTMASLTATRGCPQQCAFCSSKHLWHRKWRKRAIPRVMDELRFLRDNYGVNTVVFNDENLVVDRRWLLDFLRELKTLGLTWISGGGLSVRSLADPEVVEAMYDSGIGLFNLAIESGSDETLRRVHKALTIDEVHRAMRNIRTLGNGYAVGFFIVGFPFEDRAGVENTLSFAASLDLDWKSIYCFQPFPGCELYEYSLQQGLIEGFDINYGEVYHAPKMKYIDYTSQELDKWSYLANLRMNFLENRNLLRGDETSLSQAERDFLYVEDMAPGHAMAQWGLAKVNAMRGKPDQAREYLQAAKAAELAGTFPWRQYLDQLGVSLYGGL